MEGFCRGCLVKYDEPGALYQYTERNRRLFIYSTGLQVKRNDIFVFQLCKDCHHTMKIACSFKKTCKNSDKKLKNYFACKEAGENIDFCTYLKNNDLLKLRLPIAFGSSTPANYKKDDDNDSTCTSIQNFMTDMLPSEEIPDSEARIIREVIEEEADILEDSLDSHWLQDDASVDTDFRLDFSFSPFSTPRSGNAAQYFTPTKEMDENISMSEHKLTTSVRNDLELKPTMQSPSDAKLHIDKEKKCTIDMNLENALQNQSADKVYLEELLATPPVIPNISAPSTPLISNILFGEKIEEDNAENNQEEIDMLDEFLRLNKMGLKESERYENFEDINIDEKLKIGDEINKTIPASPPQPKYRSTDIYCDMCNRHFKHLRALSIHCVKYHKIKIKCERKKPNKPRKRKRFICDQCGKNFASSRCIIKHLANHKKSVDNVCEFCTLKFRTEKALKLHMSTHTGPIVPKNVTNKYVCNECGKMCTSSSNYNTHLRRHRNQFKIACEECGKGFYRNSDLIIHMRKHTGEKPFQCIHCPRSFARTDGLNRHIKVHTGEKPFPCNFCGNKFAKSHELKVHQKNSKTCLEQQLDIVIKEKENELEENVLVWDAGPISGPIEIIQPGGVSGLT